MESRVVRFDDPLVTPLVRGLVEEYEERYGTSEELASTVVDDFEPPAGLFLVVVDDGTTVAGGGLRRVADDRCEIKRMWTHAGRRRQGLASRVLVELETHAVRLGYTSVVLETGPRQPEAHGLYQRHGYETVPTYGRYEDATAYEKRVT